jgi:hypothetical protein
VVQEVQQHLLVLHLQAAELVVLLLVLHQVL